MRPIGTSIQLQRRRRHALKLLKRGWPPEEVAELVGATSRSLRRWRQTAKRGKRKRPTARRLPGHPCRLSFGQLKCLKQTLKRGARAYGYSAEYWSLARVRRLIQKEFRVTYHRTGVWRLLRRLKWRCQKPQRLSLQRDEAEIAYWKRYRWPWIKKVADLGRNPCFP